MALLYPSANGVQEGQQGFSKKTESDLSVFVDQHAKTNHRHHDDFGGTAHQVQRSISYLRALATYFFLLATFFLLALATFLLATFFLLALATFLLATLALATFFLLATLALLASGFLGCLPPRGFGRGENSTRCFFAALRIDSSCLISCSMNDDLSSATWLIR